MWEELPFPKLGTQVTGTIHPAPRPLHLYLVMINENKTLFVTIHILYTETAVSLIFST